MKIASLMTATALAGMLTAAPAFAQSDPAQDPATPAPPATMESMPETAPDAAPGATTPETGMPDAATPDMGTDTQAQSPDALDTDAKSTDQAAAPTEMFLQQQATDEVLASSLIGAEVRNSSDESLGNISDLVLTEDGSVQAIIIGVGGFLGIGEKNVAVSYSAVEHTTDADGEVQLTLNVERDELESAPAYVTVEEETDIDPPAAASDPMAPPPANQ